MNKIQHEIKAQDRTILGRKVKSLRQQGILPSTLYGNKIESRSIQFDKKELIRIYKECGESALIELHLGQNKMPILFKNAQYDPLSSDLIHVDCYQVNLKEKIIAQIPIHIIGESEAVKAGNVLVQALNEIEVEALPADLPENITVDISILTEVEQMILVKDIVVDRSKVEIKTNEDQMIVKIEEPRVEEEPAVETVAPGDVPAMEQKSPEEVAAAEAQAAKEKSDEGK